MTSKSREFSSALLAAFAILLCSVNLPAQNAAIGRAKPDRLQRPREGRRHGLGQHGFRCVSQAGFALVWKNQAWEIHAGGGRDQGGYKPAK